MPMQSDYMLQRDLNFKEELEKMVDSLYTKYVPANVREFIIMKSSQVTLPKPKKEKAAAIDDDNSCDLPKS